MKLRRLLSLLVIIAYIGMGPGVFSRPVAPPAQSNATSGEQTSRKATYRNPIIDLIGPADPAVILYNGTYYLYPTLDGKGYDVFVSKDLVNWERKGKCFMDSRRGAWAPDVFHDTKGGKFYLYYTVNRPGGGKQIGVAVADGPLGLFKDRGNLVDFAIDAHRLVEPVARFVAALLEHGDHAEIRHRDSDRPPIADTFAQAQ